MIPFSQIKSVFEFTDGIENSFEGCLMIIRELILEQDIIFEQYALQFGKDKEDFMKKFFQFYWPSRPDAEVIRERPRSELTGFVCDGSHKLVTSLIKSSFGKARAKITRTFSMSRRPSLASLTSAGPSCQTLAVEKHTNIPSSLPRPTSSASKTKFGRLSHLMSPHFSSPMSRKQSISTMCLNNLTVSSLLKYPSMQALPTNT